MVCPVREMRKGEREGVVGGSQRERERERGGEEVKQREGWARWRTAHLQSCAASRWNTRRRKSSVSSLLKVSSVFCPNFPAPRCAEKRWSELFFFLSSPSCFASMLRAHTHLEDLNFYQKQRAPSCRWDFMFVRRDFCIFFLAERESKSLTWSRERKRRAVRTRGWVRPGHVLMKTRVSSL